MKSSFPRIFSRSHRKNTVLRREFVFPAREWVAILCVGLLLLLGGVGYAAFVFWNGTEIAGEVVKVESETDSVYNQGKVTKVLDTYAEKQKQFTEQKNAISSSVQSDGGTRASSTTRSATSTSLAIPVAGGGHLQVE